MDLNVIIEKDSTRDNHEVILEKVKRCIKLDIKEIGLAVCIDGSRVNNIPQPVQLTVDQLSLGPNVKIKIYSRLNVSIDDGLQLHKLGQSTMAKQYQLLAIQPKTEKVFSQILGGNLDCDIITFDFTEKSTFNWRKANFTIPKLRGVLMEINYSDLFLSQSNRHNVLCYGQNLVRKLKGKYILLSSGAFNLMSLRGPYCVASLGLLFGLKENEARDAVFINGINAVRHSEVRKNPAISAVSLADQLLSCEKWVEKELLSIKNDCDQAVKEREECSSPKRVKTT